MICSTCHGSRTNQQTGYPCETCGGFGSQSCCGDSICQPDEPKDETQPVKIDLLRSGE